MSLINCACSPTLFFGVLVWCSYIVFLNAPAVPSYWVFLDGCSCCSLVFLLFLTIYSVPTCCSLLFLGVSVIPWYSCCFLGVPSVPAVLGCSLVLLLFGMHGYGNPAYSSRLGNVTKLTAETPRNSSNTEEQQEHLGTARYSMQEQQEHQVTTETPRNTMER